MLLPLQLPNPTNSSFLVSSNVSVRNLGYKQKESGKWESSERIPVVYRASKRRWGWEPQQKESQVSSPLPHFHCNAFTINPLSIQESESQETGSRLSNSSLMPHPALSLLPSGGKRENLALSDSTTGDGEMDTDSLKPYISCGSF